MSEPVIHCWESNGNPDDPGTCMLFDGHDGPHEFTSDSNIVITFAGEAAQ